MLIFISAPPQICGQDESCARSLPSLMGLSWQQANWAFQASPATLSRSHQSFHSQMERSKANSPPSKFWICLRLCSYLEAYVEEFSTWKMLNGPAGLIRSSSRSRCLWDLLWLWPLKSCICGLTSCNCAQDGNNLWILVWQTWRFQPVF